MFKFMYDVLFKPRPKHNTKKNIDLKRAAQNIHGRNHNIRTRQPTNGAAMLNGIKSNQNRMTQPPLAILLEENGLSKTLNPSYNVDGNSVVFTVPFVNANKMKAAKQHLKFTLKTGAEIRGACIRRTP